MRDVSLSGHLEVIADCAADGDRESMRVLIAVAVLALASPLAQARVSRPLGRAQAAARPGGAQAVAGPRGSVRALAAGERALDAPQRRARARRQAGAASGALAGDRGAAGGA